MNSNSTSKLPGRTLRNLAIAGSLFLHVGLIAVFSSWQWELDRPPKNLTKVVKIKILPASKIQKDVRKPVPVKTAGFSPAQPVAVTSTAISALDVRTPSLPVPSHQAPSQVKQVTPSKKRHFKRRLIQQTSMSAPVAKSQAVQPMKVIQRNPGAIRKFKLRSSSLFDSYQTESVQAVVPVKVKGPAQQRILPRKAVIQQTHSSYSSNVLPQTAIFVKIQKPGADNIRHRSALTLSQAKLPNESGLTAQQAAQPFKLSSPSRTRFAALPRKLFPASPKNSSMLEANLNGLRGMFTGKVRQRIANAKYYPRIARRRGMEGQPVIAFTLDKGGRLMKADLAQTSGYQLLDQAALDAVHQAAPYPEIPAELKTDTFQFKLPISFILK